MAPPSNKGVYWIGADGNTYVRAAGINGVKNMGSAQGTGTMLRPIGGNWGGLTRIADPNPPAPTQQPQQAGAQAPAYSNGGGGGGGGGASAPAKPDRSNSIALQQAGLSAVDAQEQAGLSAVDRALARIFGMYDSETQANESSYKEQSNTNMNSLQRNKQTSYVNAAQGRRGLFGTLAGIGALSGDGIKLANRAVQSGANQDLSAASETYGQNQVNLDTSIDTYRRQDKTRREQNIGAAEDARTNVRGTAAKSRQQFFSNLANDYADMGNAGEAKRYTDLAASMYPLIASTSVPSTNLSYNAAAFTPGALANYIGGSANTAVTTSGPDAFGIPGLAAVSTRKKKA